MDTPPKHQELDLHRPGSPLVLTDPFGFALCREQPDPTWLVVRESSPALALPTAPDACMGTTLDSRWMYYAVGSLRHPRSAGQNIQSLALKGGGSGPFQPLPLPAEGASVKGRQSASKVDSCSLHRGRTRKKVSASSRWPAGLSCTL